MSSEEKVENATCSFEGPDPPSTKPPRLKTGKSYEFSDLAEAAILKKSTNRRRRKVLEPFQRVMDRWLKKCRV
jgi:hypothetical protein